MSDKKFYLFAYLLSAVFIVVVELIIAGFMYLFNHPMTFKTFWVTFACSCGIIFFTFSLIFIIEDDKKCQEKQKNPWAYHKR